MYRGDWIFFTNGLSLVGPFVAVPQAPAPVNRGPKSQNRPLLSNIDRLIRSLLCMEAWAHKKKVVKKGNLKEIIGNVDTKPLVDLVFRLIIEELI